MLKITDSFGTYDYDIQSEQVEVLLEDIDHISDTSYFWTVDNYIVDIAKDVDVTLSTVQKTIEGS